MNGQVGFGTKEGRLTKITDASGSTAYEYDQFGRVTVKTQSVASGASTKVLVSRMSYGTSGASNGRLSSLTYPSGSRVNYGYGENNQLGQLTSLTLNPAAASGGGTNTASTIALMSEIRYTGIGQARSWTWGNHSAQAPNQYARSFDALGRVTSFPLGTGNAAALPPCVRLVVVFLFFNRLEGQQPWQQFIQRHLSSRRC